MMALGGIGPYAGVALPTILKATHDPFWVVRGVALESLIKIKADPDVVIPPLISALRDKQGFVQITAANGLGQLGPARKRRYRPWRRRLLIARFRDRAAAKSAPQIDPARVTNLPCNCAILRHE